MRTGVRNLNIGDCHLVRFGFGLGLVFGSVWTGKLWLSVR